MESDSQAYPFLRPAASSALTGGCLITLTLTPFDVIKNYWYYNNTLDANRTRISSLYVVKHLYNTRGIKAFWNGSTWATVNTISGQVIFLWLFESLKESHNVVFSSVFSRIAALLVSTPFDCIKTWNQANMFDSKSKTPIELFKLTNLTKLYSGFFPTIIRDIPYSAIHWSCYDYLINKSHNVFRLEDSKYFSKYVALPLFCGTISSTLAVLSSQPFDIMKTNIQAKISNPNGPDKCFKLSYFYNEFIDIYSKGGLKGFGIGIFPRAARAVPSSAIMAAAYEYFKNSHVSKKALND